MSHHIQSQMSVRQWALLVLLSLVWGGSFFFVEIALEALPPLTLVWGRVTLAALVLWGVIWLVRIRCVFSLRVLFMFAVMGILNSAIPFTLIVWGQTEISSGLASILNATTPFFTLVVAGAFLADERLSWRKMVGVLFGVLGVSLIMGLDKEAGNTPLWALVFPLLAALSYAFASVFGRQFKGESISPIVAAAGQVSMASVVLLPLVLWVDQPLQLDVISMEPLVALMALGILSTAFAYVIYFKVLEVSGAVNIVLVTLLVPVSAVTLGVVVLNETLESLQLAGFLLIAFGLSIIDGRVWRYLGFRLSRN